MNFNEYQDLTADTAIYPEAGTGHINAITYTSLGLGEVGEIQGKVKKVLRDDGGIVKPEARDAIVAELGDVLWYLSQLSTELGTSLEFVAQENLAKLNSRKERGVLQGSGDER